MEILESKGKDLLYLKASKFKDEQVDTWINGAAISAAGLGSIPIPAADMIPLTALQVGLAMKTAFIYECEVTKKDVMQLVAATVTGGLGRQIYRLGIQGLKGLGWFGGPFGEGAVMAVAAGVAASVTYGFGHACKAYYKSGMTLELDGIGEIFRNMQKQYKKNKASLYEWRGGLLVHGKRRLLRNLSQDEREAFAQGSNRATLTLYIIPLLMVAINTAYPW